MGVGVLLGVGVLVGVLVGVGVFVGVGVWVGVGVDVGVLVGVSVGVGVFVGVGDGVLVKIETANAAALVGLAVGSEMATGADWVKLASLTIKRPKARTSVAPKATRPRRERFRRE